MRITSLMAICAKRCASLSLLDASTTSQALPMALKGNRWTDKLVSVRNIKMNA
jgi:hypothetical protein